MSKIKRLIEAIAEVNDLYPTYIDYIDCMWTRGDGDYVTWNVDNNKEDMFEGDLNTYQCEIREQGEVVDDYYVVNVDTGCGDTQTLIFDLSEEVKDGWD